MAYVCIKVGAVQIDSRDPDSSLAAGNGRPGRLVREAPLGGWPETSENATGKGTVKTHRAKKLMTLKRWTWDSSEGPRVDSRLQTEPGAVDALRVGRSRL